MPWKKVESKYFGVPKFPTQEQMYEKVYMIVTALSFFFWSSIFNTASQNNQASQDVIMSEFPVRGHDNINIQADEPTHHWVLYSQTLQAAIHCLTALKPL